MKTIAKSFETAFVYYKNNVWSYIKGMSIIFLILFLTLFLSLFTLFRRDTFYMLGQLMSGAADSATVFAGVEPFAIMLTSIFAGVGIAAAYACVAGIVEFTASLVRKKKADMMSTMNRAVRERGLVLVVAKVLTSAFLVIAFAASLIAGTILSFFIASDYVLGAAFYTILLTSLLVVGVLFSVVDQSVVIDKARPFTALTRSYRFAKKNFLDLLIFTLFFIVVSNILGYIPFFGFILSLFVLTPISIATYTYFYIKNK